MKTFSIISALDRNRGIGKNNRLPWHIPGDMKHFAEETKGSTVMMGRKTWESLPEKYRPLPGRLNIVISRGELNLPTGALLAHSLEDALELAEAHEPERKAFVIGGATLYTEAINHPACTELLLTEIESTFDCDAFFPEIPQDFKKEESQSQQEGEISFCFVTYKRPAISGI